MYVENYENISDLKFAIISAFQENRIEWLLQAWRTSVNDWKWSFGTREGIFKNKVVMFLCVVYIKTLMFIVHFEHMLIEIGRIELELFKS